MRARTFALSRGEALKVDAIGGMSLHVSTGGLRVSDCVGESYLHRGESMALSGGCTTLITAAEPSVFEVRRGS